MKTCFKCNEAKPIDEFYKHPRMGDGHLGKCKECTKIDVQKRYDEHPEKIALYERKRAKNYARKMKTLEYRRVSRKRNTLKWKARNMVARYIKSGKLTRPRSCQICKTECTPQAHHTDYTKPIDVQWLCFKCHRVHGHGQRVNEL